MHEVELVLALLVAVVALGLLATRLNTPYPIVLVIGGVLIGLLPINVSIQLEPQVVFLLFLPPLLYVAAFFTSIRDFKTHAKPILLLAIGLVLATTVGVAVVAHALIPGMSWAAAFALGAIVSRGGRPDLAGATLPQVHAPTLLIVGGEDHVVIDLNRTAFDQLGYEKQLVIVPGATHLFEEPSALEDVARLASQWFARYLSEAGAEAKMAR